LPKIGGIDFVAGELTGSPLNDMLGMFWVCIFCKASKFHMEVCTMEDLLLAVMLGLDVGYGNPDLAIQNAREELARCCSSKDEQHQEEPCSSAETANE